MHIKDIIYHTLCLISSAYSGAVHMHSINLGSAVFHLVAGNSEMDCSILI